MMRNSSGANGQNLIEWFSVAFRIAYDHKPSYLTFSLDRSSKAWMNAISEGDADLEEQIRRQRDRMNRHGYSALMDKTAINFPESFNSDGVFTDIGGGGIYDLQSVIVNRGGAHYVTYVKSIESGIWFLCNDDICEETRFAGGVNNDETRRLMTVLIYKLKVPNSSPFNGNVVRQEFLIEEMENAKAFKRTLDLDPFKTYFTHKQS